MRKGISLIETAIALGIFAFVAMATANILIAAKNAQFKAAAIQSVVDNVRFGLEAITKELRTGTGFDLVNCNGVTDSQINFRDQFNRAIGYAFYAPTPGAGAIYKISNWAVDSNCVNGTPVTAPEVIIDSWTMRLNGTATLDGQPRLTLSFKAKAIDPKLQQYTRMNLQTTITQRVRDINQ